MNFDPTMKSDALLWLFQANDSAYPSGAYAHSYGLEELVESGLIVTAGDLETFLEKQVIPALLVFEIPFFVRAHSAAVKKSATPKISRPSTGRR